MFFPFRSLFSLFIGYSVISAIWTVCFDWSSNHGPDRTEKETIRFINLKKQKNIINLKKTNMVLHLKVYFYKIICIITYFFIIIMCETIVHQTNKHHPRILIMHRVNKIQSFQFVCWNWIWNQFFVLFPLV